MGMTNGEKIQQDFKGCEVCEPIFEDNIIHVIFADKPHSAIGFDWDWWNAEYKEPRKAIWIERSDIPTGCGEYLCSKCMDEYGTDLLYTYCPNCGAYHGKNKETIKEKDFWMDLGKWMPYREHKEGNDETT